MEDIRDNSRNNPADNESSVDIRQLIEQYGYYWKWILLSVVLAIGVAYVALRYATRIYQSSAKVMVLDKASSSIELNALGGLSPLTPNTVLDDQIQIIRSSKLMQEVVRKNKFYIVYHEMGRINNKELLADDLPFSLQILDKTETQQENLTLDIKLGFSEGGRIAVHQGHDGTTAVLGKPFVVDGVKLVISAKVDRPVAGRNFMVAIRPLVSTANALKGALTVGRSEKSNTILNLGYTSFSTEKAEIILRDLIVAYDNDLSNDKNKVTLASTTFINERLNLISQDLQRADKRVEDFKTSNRLIDVETNAGITQGELTSFEKQLFDLRFQQDLIKHIQKEVQNRSMNILPENLGLQSGDITTAVSNLNRLLLERESLLRSATEENPAVARLTEQVDLLYNNLNASIDNALQMNSLNIRNVEGKLRSLRSDLGSVPRRENDFKSIARQQQIVEAMYLFLLQKREETEIAASAKPENIKIIEPAKGYGPIAPVARNYYLIGLVVGIVLPIAILFVKFLLDNKIHSRKDIEDKFSAPILGELPTSEEPIVKDNDRSSLAEAFRILRTNITFMLGAKKDTAVIFVTSTTSGEGKSFVATNLSRILSMSGKRVLLVGADIRSPKVLDYLGLSYLQHTNVGITQYLINPDMDIANIVIRKPEGYDFDIIYSGYVAPNPAELLMNGHFDDIVAYGRQHYDYVLVDTAPVGLVTDTLLIGQNADLTIYVARANFLDKRLLNIPKELYEDGRLKNMAVVLNDVDFAKGYGYGYGYGYGDNRNKSLRERLKQRAKSLFKQKRGNKHG